MKKTSFRILRSLRLLIIVLGAIVALAGIFWTGPVAPKAQEKEPAGSLFNKFANPDSITEAVRDPSNDLVRVNIHRSTDRLAARQIGTTVAEYGSFIILAKDRKTRIQDQALDQQPIDTSINLPGKRFEPLDGSVGDTVYPGSPLPAGADGGPDYYIVQLAGYTKDEWLESFRDLGAEVIQYVPHQAFLVYADADVIQKIAGHSRVRWVGRYTPEQKLSKHLNRFRSGLKTKTAVFDVAVFARADLLKIRNEVLSGSASPKAIAVQKLPHNFFNLIRVRTTPDDIDRIARLKDVVRIDPYVKPVPEDERAAQIVAGNYSSPTVLNPPGYDPLTQFGVDGTNVTVAISDDGVSIPGDGGFYLTSSNVVNGPLRGATAGAASGHGHLNASIVAGTTPYGGLDPTNYNYGEGVAPKANIINIPFLKTNNTTTEEQSVEDTVNTAGPNGVKGSIINNSWGGDLNGNAYDSWAALWDGLVMDATTAGTIDPITVVFSAGNSGPSGLTRPKAAKNPIAVGNSENIRTELGGTAADNIEDLRLASSRGPTADGRIKPDVTAPGTYITGSRAGDLSGVWGAIDDYHVYSTGTSHSAPQVTGVAALFTEFWKNNAGGNPSPALIKAAIINSAQDMNGTNVTDPVPNGDEGWGLVDMKYMFNTGVSMKYVNQNVAFYDSSDAPVIFNGIVGDSTKPVRVSLVWTDPPGIADPALVNDLDLTVTVGFDVYKGNVFANGFSTTGGLYSTVDNVENVFLPAGIPAGTSFSIQVAPVSINGDGIPGNGDATDQHFALVAYNYSPAAPHVRTPFDFDGDDRTDVSVFRPSPSALIGAAAPEGSGSQWWVLWSGTRSARGYTFGTATDVIAPADFTGDGKTDIAFFRPSTGEWYVLRSEDETFYGFPFGSTGDIPAPGDFDGDGTADVAVYRPSQGTWYILRSSDQNVDVVHFGIAEDKPTVADFDGDGKDDIAIYRPSVSEWWQLRSSAGVIAYQFGSSGDRTVVGDYTGDGKADVAFFRPSTSEWYVLRSENSSFFSFPWGTTGDIPAPGDYDGDGTTDSAIFRPSEGAWYINGSTSGFVVVPFGLNGDVPLPSAFLVD